MKQLLLAAALLAPWPAMAQSVSASLPDTIRIALDQLGLEPQMGQTSTGVPAIVGTLDGATFTVLFYSCDDPRGCQDLQLRAVFATQSPVPLDKLNDWNKATFMGKAFQSDDTIVLEHPIAGVTDMPAESFNRTLIRWQVALNGFRQHMTSSPENSE